jgi:hypothetical protein
MLDNRDPVRHSRDILVSGRCLDEFVQLPLDGPAPAIVWMLCNKKVVPLSSAHKLRARA